MTTPSLIDMFPYFPKWTTSKGSHHTLFLKGTSPGALVNDILIFTFQYLHDNKQKNRLVHKEEYSALKLIVTHSPGTVHNGVQWKRSTLRKNLRHSASSEESSQSLYPSHLNTAGMHSLFRHCHCLLDEQFCGAAKCLIKTQIYW